MISIVFAVILLIVGVMVWSDIGGLAAVGAVVLTWLFLIVSRAIFLRIRSGMLRLKLVDPRGPVYQVKPGLYVTPVPDENRKNVFFFNLLVDGGRYFMTIDPSQRVYSLSVPVGEFNSGPVVDMEGYDRVPWVKLIADELCVERSQR